MSTRISAILQALSTLVTRGAPPSPPPPPTTTKGHSNSWFFALTIFTAKATTTTTPTWCRLDGLSRMSQGPCFICTSVCSRRGPLQTTFCGLAPHSLHIEWRAMDPVQEVLFPGRVGNKAALLHDTAVHKIDLRECPRRNLLFKPPLYGVTLWKVDWQQQSRELVCWHLVGRTGHTLFADCYICG